MKINALHYIKIICKKRHDRSNHALFDLTSFLLFKTIFIYIALKPFPLSSYYPLCLQSSSLTTAFFPYLSTEIALSKVTNEFPFPKYNPHFNLPFFLNFLCCFALETFSFAFLIYWQGNNMIRFLIFCQQI